MAHGVDAFNRTILELKLFYLPEELFKLETFNRTILPNCLIAHCHIAKLPLQEIEFFELIEFIEILPFHDYS